MQFHARNRMNSSGKERGSSKDKDKLFLCYTKVSWIMMKWIRGVKTEQNLASFIIFFLSFEIAVYLVSTWKSWKWQKQETTRKEVYRSFSSSVVKMPTSCAFKCWSYQGACANELSLQKDCLWRYRWYCLHFQDLEFEKRGYLSHSLLLK